MDIPPHLTDVFQMLENHGYKIKQHHGRGTRRYIKFDEHTLGLYLEVKLPNEDRWIRLSPNQVRGMNEMEDRSGIGNLRHRLFGNTRNTGRNANLQPIGNRNGARGSSAASAPNESYANIPQANDPSLGGSGSGEQNPEEVNMDELEA